MTTLGVTTDSASTSPATTAKSIASVSTASADGIVASGGARIWVASGSVSVQEAIWADNSGVPGALLALSDSLAVTQTTESELAFTFSGANQIAIVNGVPYWVGLTWALPGTTVTWSRGSAGTGAIKTINSQAPNPFGTATDLNGPLDAYVNFFPAPSTDDGAFFEFF